MLGRGGKKNQTNSIQSYQRKKRENANDISADEYSPDKTTHTKSNETLENDKAILQIELNNLKQIFEDIKDKYYLEPKIKKPQKWTKSSKKGNENQPISEKKWEKKTIIFEIKDKLQNAQGRMNFSENLTKETLKTEK